MHKLYWMLILWIGIGVQSIHAQEKFTLSGYVKDLDTGEELIGASIIVKEITTGTTTNVYGFYSLTLPQGNYNIIYSFIGYKSIQKQVTLDRNIKSDIEIQPDNLQLQEVVIAAEKDNQNVEQVQMSVEKLNMETIQKNPAVVG